MIARGFFRGNPEFVLHLKRLGDLALTIAGGYVTHHLVYASFERPLMHDRQALMLVLLVLVLLFSFEQLGLYRANRTTRLSTEVQALAGGWLTGLVVVGGTMWLRDSFDANAPRWLGLWLIAGLGGSIALRVIARQALGALRRHGYNQRSVVIAVASDLGRDVCERLLQRPDLGFMVLGFFDDRVAARGEPARLPVIGAIDAMPEYVARHHVDEVWVALPFRAEARIRNILHAMRHSTTDVCLVPDVFQFYMLNQSLGEVAGMPVLTLTSSPMHGFNRCLKALEDRVLAALFLLVLSPLMLLIALAIRLDSPGPALFRQPRNGWNGDSFDVLKYRTMYVHNEQPGVFSQATRGDRRITRIGGFLRRTSLDELPQFINVLMGSMSIVGPRPHPVAMNEAFKDAVDRYMLRHKVKPGITGWAQVNGLRGELRSPDMMELRVQHDLYYIEHWSIWLDLRIMVMTVFKGLVHENAY